MAVCDRAAQAHPHASGSRAAGIFGLAAVAPSRGRSDDARQLQDRLDAIPGVRTASYSLHTPQDLCCINLNIIIGGRAGKWIEDVNVIFSRVSPRY